MAGNASSTRDKTYNLKFTLSDGNVIDAGEFTVPNGEKGDKGDKGDTGATPDVSCPASVNASVGTPSVTVTKSGTTASPSFAFSFKNLKGEQGIQGIQGVSVVGATLTEVK